MKPVGARLMLDSATRVLSRAVTAQRSARAEERHQRIVASAVALAASSCSSRIAFEAAATRERSTETSIIPLLPEDAVLDPPSARNELPPAAEMARWPALSGLRQFDELYHSDGPLVGGDPAPIDPEAGALMGVWQGMLGYPFWGSGSRHISVTVNGSGEGYLVLGTGNAPAPPQHADAFFPSGQYAYPHTDFFAWTFSPRAAFRYGVYEGFRYPIRLLQIATELKTLALEVPVTLRASTSDLYSEWCALQRPPVEGSGFPEVTRGLPVPIGNGDQCDFVSSYAQVIAREPCWKRELCILHCFCYDGECGANEQTDIELDGQLDGDTMNVWVRFPAPPIGDAVVTHALLHKVPEGPR